MGRQYGPDGKTQIIRVDGKISISCFKSIADFFHFNIGPHAAPAEHFARYGTLMLVGAGIGLTPCVSILTALTKYRWKKNFNPELLHFYWIIRYNEIDSFQWLIHMLTDISYELKKAKHNHQIERRYYCEINIFITGYDPKTADQERGSILSGTFYRPAKKRFLSQAAAGVNPTFTAEELYGKMLAPTVTSKDMISKMKATTHSMSHDKAGGKLILDHTVIPIDFSPSLTFVLYRS